MKALILAGGLGTRLQPVVADRPKPMAQANGKPFLEYQIEWLRRQGLREIVLCVGHLAGHIRDYFGAGQRWDVRIRYAVETELLGTAGAIKNAEPFVEDTFCVLNGDSFLDADLQAIIESHKRSRAVDPRTLGTLAAVFVPDAAAYGTLDLGHHRVSQFREKGTGGPGWINGGIYVLEPEILELIPAGRPVSIERETFPQILERGYHLYAYPVEGFFVDIGTPAGYHRFQHYVETENL